VELPKSLTTVTTLSKILAGVLFVTFPLVAFYIGIKYQETVTRTTTKLGTTAVSPTPKLSTSLTADWKTYSNNEYNFSFKYPNYLSIEVNPIKDYGREFGLIIKDKKSLNDFDKYFSLDLLLYSDKNNKDLLELGLEIVCSGGISPLELTGVSQSDCEKENENRFITSQIGDINIISADLLIFESTSHIILFEGEGKIYQIYLWGLEGTVPSKLAKETVYQILSTFKFTDQDEPMYPQQGISDITLDPLTDWTSTSMCNINFRIYPSFKPTLANQPQTTDTTCSFGYNYKDLAGATIPVTFDVTIFKDYEGSSRREFYLSKTTFTQENNYSDDAVQYSGGKDFKAGKNTGIVLEWKDIDTGDSMSGYRVYLIATNNALLAVKSNTENDVVKMFLTGIEK